MQIRNDYHSGQGQAYSQSHSHHITECIHQEEHKKKTGNMSARSSMGKQQDTGKAAVEYVASFAVEEMSVNQSSKKKGSIKSFWDSLGEDETSSKSLVDKQAILNGIPAMAAAMQGFWEGKVIKPLVALKDRIKTMPSRAISRFGKDRGNFGELLKGGMLFDGGKSKGKKEQEKEELQMKQPEDQHLLDSYNKSGNYCRLHENLTYQKPKER